MNEKLMLIGLGVVLGALFKGLVTIGIILCIVGAVGYMYVKRTKFVKFFSKG